MGCGSTGGFEEGEGGVWGVGIILSTLMFRNEDEKISISNLQSQLKLHGTTLPSAS